MKTKTHTHNGFILTLERIPAYEWTDAFIEKGEFNGSLAMVQDLGHLEDDNGKIIKVPSDTLEYFEKMEQAFSDSI